MAAVAGLFRRERARDPPVPPDGSYCSIPNDRCLPGIAAMKEITQLLNKKSVDMKRVVVIY